MQELSKGKRACAAAVSLSLVGAIAELLRDELLLLLPRFCCNSAPTGGARRGGQRGWQQNMDQSEHSLALCLAGTVL